MLRRARQALRDGRRSLGTDLDRRHGGGGPRAARPACRHRARASARGPPRRDRAADPGRGRGQDGPGAGIPAASQGNRGRAAPASLAAGLRTTVVTFRPHPRTILGNRVELITTVERRLELISALGVDETLLLEFTLDLARLEPEEFAESVLRRIGVDVVVAGPNFRFGRGASGDLELLGRLGFD